MKKNACGQNSTVVCVGGTQCPTIINCGLSFDESNDVSGHLQSENELTSLMTDLRSKVNCRSILGTNAPTQHAATTSRSPSTSPTIIPSLAPTREPTHTQQSPTESNLVSDINLYDKEKSYEFGDFCLKM